MFYRVGIYTRESRDENEQNIETIEVQKNLLIEYIKKKNLGELARVYIDDNVSGSGFEREGIEKLRRDVKEGAINLLLLKDLSRLGRNNAKTLLFLDFLEEYNVRVLTYDGKYDSLKDNDTVGIETWFNERYIKDISKKIRANLRYKIKSGEYLGTAPFGYEKSIEKRNTLVVNFEEAFVVRKIFKLYREGYGYMSIAKRLNIEGCPSPSKRNNMWNGVSIKRILKNRVYIGDTVQGVSEKVSFKSKKTRRLPEDMWVITPNTHEAIIQRDEFEKIQEMVKNKKNPAFRNKGKPNILSGIIYCGKCNKSMYARKRKNRPTGYICSSYAKKGKSACDSHYIREDVIVRGILDEIKRLLQDKEVFINALKKLENKKFGGKNVFEEIAKINKTIKSKQKQQDTMYMDKLEGRITQEMFERVNQTIVTKIRYLEDQIKRLERERQNDNSFEDLYKKIINGLDELIKRGFLGREAVGCVVEKIIVNIIKDTPIKTTTVEIIYKY